MNAPQRTKKPVNLSLDEELVEEARALGLTLSAAAEAGLRAAVREEKGRRWLEENAEAIRSSNEWVEKNGLPLEKYRMF
jgi:antitoxin CcdA